MYTEDTTPTPDQAGERVRDFIQKHKEKHKGLPGTPTPPSSNPAADEWHREQDRLEKRIRSDRATAFEEDINEGGMGWINRAAPSHDVSYDKVLDTVIDKWKGDKVAVNEISKGAEKKWVAGANKWRDEQTAKGGGADPKIVAKADKRAERTMKIKNKHEQPLNELSINMLKQHNQGVKQMDPATTPKYKMVKHHEGEQKAAARIAHMTGDRNSKMYEAKLEEILEAFDANAFADILGKQNQEVQAAKPKTKVVDIDFHGWTIKYRNTQPAEWVVMDKKGETKHKGESPTPKEAVADAEAFIKGGGGTKQQASSNVTIDFNVDFAKEFAPDGETFYATIDQDEGAPMLIFSTMPEKSLKKSHIRTQASKVTSGTTKLPMISMSPAESNKMGLQPNGRYTLGDKIPVDDNTAMFPLIYQGTVQGKGDMMKMGRPGLTVAHSRD